MRLLRFRQDHHIHPDQDPNQPQRAHQDKVTHLELPSLGRLCTRCEKVAKVVRQRRVRERLMKYMLRLDTLRSSLMIMVVVMQSAVSL